MTTNKTSMKMMMITLKTIIKIKMQTFKMIHKIKTIFHSLLMIKTKNLINLSSKKEESSKKLTNNLNETSKEKRFCKNI